MGNHRLNVEVSVAGKDNKQHKIDWWVNWFENKPARLYKELCELAEKAGLPVDYGEIFEDNYYIQELEDEIEELRTCQKLGKYNVSYFDCIDWKRKTITVIAKNDSQVEEYIDSLIPFDSRTEPYSNGEDSVVFELNGEVSAPFEV